MLPSLTLSPRSFGIVNSQPPRESRTDGRKDPGGAKYGEPPTGRAATGDIRGLSSDFHGRFNFHITPCDLMKYDFPRLLYNSLS